jgi:tetratricopeptide (TPR) repeat protein
MKRSSSQSFARNRTPRPERIDRRPEIPELEAPLPAQFEGPAPAEIFYNCGAALWNRGRAPEAIEMIDAALKSRPDYPEALCLGGFILSEAGQIDASLRFYHRAIELRPDFLIALANSGKLLFGLRRFDAALAAFDRTIALAPADADAWNNRAGALRELGRLDESLAAFRQALALRPDFPEAMLNCASVLMKLDRHEGALSAYRKAKALKADFGAAFCGEGLTLAALGQFEDALAAFDEAVRLKNQDGVSNRGCLLLMLGRFKEGWEGYEHRWLAGKSLKEALGSKYPEWSGRLVPGERLLVMNDHGLGDTLQFSRYALIAARAGAEVTLLCPKKLHRLFAAYEDVRVIDEIQRGETFDAQVAVSSMPRAFGTRLDTIPAPVPYLRAEEALRAKWAARIGSEGFKIGINWQGSPNPEADLARSFPLAELAALAALPGVRLISLQKGVGIEQLDYLPEGMIVETLGEDFDAGPDAFVDTAAAMAHLDLIVTCDTSVAHLAGAFGVPVWVALKRVAEWRWLRDREDSPWYPTMRLFRQRERGDWRELFVRMATALEPLVKPKGSAPGQTAIAIPGAVGELIDKITILEIKSERISDPGKLANVRAELALLRALQASEGLTHPRLDELRRDLKAVNAELWDIEDDIRICEKRGDFGPSFVALARAVYRTNDGRAALKLEINRMFNSAIVEEKSYA